MMEDGIKTIHIGQDRQLHLEVRGKLISLYITKPTFDTHWEPNGRERIYQQDVTPDALRAVAAAMLERANAVDGMNDQLLRVMPSVSGWVAFATPAGEMLSIPTPGYGEHTRVMMSVEAPDMTDDQIHKLALSFLQEQCDLAHRYVDVTTLGVADLADLMRGLAYDAVPVARGDALDHADHLVALVRYGLKMGGAIETRHLLLTCAYFAHDMRVNYQEMASLLLSMTPELNDQSPDTTGDDGSGKDVPLGTPGAIPDGTYNVAGGFLTITTHHIAPSPMQETATPLDRGAAIDGTTPTHLPRDLFILNKDETIQDLAARWRKYVRSRGNRPDDIRAAKDAGIRLDDAAQGD